MDFFFSSPVQLDERTRFEYVFMCVHIKLLSSSTVDAASSSAPLRALERKNLNANTKLCSPFMPLFIGHIFVYLYSKRVACLPNLRRVFTQNVCIEFMYVHIDHRASICSWYLCLE